jgi:hypothetical protein
VNESNSCGNIYMNRSRAAPCLLRVRYEEVRHGRRLERDRAHEFARQPGLARHDELGRVGLRMVRRVGRPPVVNR